MDALLKDLAAVLLQYNNPFAFASKALTDVETRYVNLEREILTVVYGFEKFREVLHLPVWSQFHSQHLQHAARDNSPKTLDSRTPTYLEDVTKTATI